MEKLRRKRPSKYKVINFDLFAKLTVPQMYVNTIKLTGVLRWNYIYIYSLISVLAVKYNADSI
jgi:hypothetical protein